MYDPVTKLIYHATCHINGIKNTSDLNYYVKTKNDDDDDDFYFFYY